MRNLRNPLLVLVLSAAAVASAATEASEFSGTVRTTDGQPVPGVTVIVTYTPRLSLPVSGLPSRQELRATSDDRGRFAVQLREPYLSLNVQVESPPKSPMRFWRMLPARDESRSDVEMKPGTETLSGKVTDEADKPVKGATVVLSWGGRSGGGGMWGQGGGRQLLEATTDARGAYRFDHLLAGQYGVEAVTPPRGSGLVPMPRTWRAHGGVFVPSAQSADFDFSLKPGCGIRGRVVDEDGKPLEGAGVSATRAAAAIDGPKVFERMGNFSDSVKTGADGRYSLEGLSPETYQVSVSPAEGSGLAHSYPLTGLRLEVGKELTCQDIVLVGGGTLEGTVKGADGKALADVTVQYGERVTQTDRQGKFRFDGLATGTSTLGLVPPEGAVYAAKTAEDVPCIAKVRVASDWTLEEGGRVSGKVTGEDGKPVAGATVYASCDNFRYSTTTDDAGQYRLAGLVESRGVDYRNQPKVYGLGVSPPEDSPYMGGGEKFSVKLGESVTCDVTLSLGGTVTGKVTDEAGKPVANARIEVFKEVGRGGRSYFGTAGPGPGRGLLTGDDGSYTVRKIPPEWVNVSAAPPEGVNLLEATRNNVGVGAGKATTVDLKLSAGGAVSGVLTGPKDAPLPWVQVALEVKTPGSRPGWARQIQPVTTDEKGRYSFMGLPEATYEIKVVMHDGKHVVAPQEVDVKPGKETAVRLSASAGAFIELTIKDPSGGPVTNASVRADPRTKGRPSVYGAVSKSGVATIGPLLADTYTVTVNAYRTGGKPYKPASIPDVTVKDSERVKREVKLEEGEKPTERPTGRTGRGG